MMRRWVITLQPDTPVGSVAQIMRLGRLRALPVVGPGGELLGVLSFQECCALIAEAVEGAAEGDLRQAIHRALATPVGERMSEAVDVIAADADMREGLRSLGRARSGHVLVVSPDDPRRLVGVLTETDLLRQAEIPPAQPSPR